MKDKSMKILNTKKVVVKCAEFWTDEHEIDADIFDDVLIEAVTRSLEERINSEGFKVAVVIEAWEKKDAKRPEKHFMHNTYKMLLNAAMHEKAETLRQNFIRMYDIDMATENLRGDNDRPTGQPEQPKSADSGSLGQ